MPDNQRTYLDDDVTSLTYSWTQLNVSGVRPERGDFLDYLPVLRFLTTLFTPASKLAAQEAQRTARVLRNCSGIAEAGEVLAVMGGSGSGKTTLLNTLAFRNARDIRVGPGSLLLANGVAIRDEQLRQYCAYVERSSDVFIGSLTTLEHLRYQAELRLDARWSKVRRQQRVADVMHELSLARCANTVIGTVGRTKGLSGGERKRLAFATETLSNPALLLCDEPTTGLDSFMSLAVLQVLQQMARKGKTVVLTIHQPSSELLAMFDKLLLLAAGRVAFYGTPAQALEFFASLGAKCPENFCPTDHYVQVLAVRPGLEAEDRAKIEAICDAYDKGAVGRAMVERVKTMGSDATSRRSFSVGGAKRQTRPSWWHQFAVCYARATRSMLKEPVLIRVRIISTVGKQVERNPVNFKDKLVKPSLNGSFPDPIGQAVSLFVGTLYWQQKLNKEGVMDMNGAMFLIILTLTYQNIFSVIDVFCLEMPVFLREARNQLYRTDAYFLAKSLAELPLFVLTPVLAMAIVYPMIGFNGSWGTVLHAFLLVTIMANVATSFSFLASCASPSMAIALSVATTVTVPITLFSGYYLNMRSIPDWLRWCPYLSWLRFSFEGWMIVQWRDYGLGAFDCPPGTLGCFPTGKHILEFFDFPEDNLTADYVGLFALFICLRLLAYLALVVRARRKE